MKIRTHWTPTDKIPRLVSCNALLGRSATTPHPRTCATRSLRFMGVQRQIASIRAPEHRDRCPHEHANRNLSV